MPPPEMVGVFLFGSMNMRPLQDANPATSRLQSLMQASSNTDARQRQAKAISQAARTPSRTPL